MNKPQEPLRLQITAQQISDSPTLKCSCGGMVFQEALLFKKISAILSPTGEEEMYPVRLIVCKNCGKVPESFDNGILPKEILDKKLIIT